MIPTILISAGILFLAGVLFLASIATILFILKEFTQVKIAATLMEAAFKDHSEMTQSIQQFVSRGLEGAEAQYGEIQAGQEQVINSVRGLNERINKVEDNIRKPMNPDVTFN